MEWTGGSLPYNFYPQHCYRVEDQPNPRLHLELHTLAPATRMSNASTNKFFLGLRGLGQVTCITSHLRGRLAGLFRFCTALRGLIFAICTNTPLRHFSNLAREGLGIVADALIKQPNSVTCVVGHSVARQKLLWRGSHSCRFPAMRHLKPHTHRLCCGKIIWSPRAAR